MYFRPFQSPNTFKMSKRWYPIYRKGNPQLRIFLPNFWLKLINPSGHKQPENVVQFACSMEMTKYDVQSYLEKIYNIPVVEVRTRIALGQTRHDAKGYVVKEDDSKIAYVTLPKDEKFIFPNIFPVNDQKQKEDSKSLDVAKETFKKYLDRNKTRPGTPGWFSL